MTKSRETCRQIFFTPARRRCPSGACGWQRWRCAPCCSAPAQTARARPSPQPIKRRLFRLAHAPSAFGPTSPGSLFQKAARTAVAKEGQPFIYLALSGGGGGGAYGAGVLNGWTESGSRPEFTVVSGVSTGALIAPFAFLGPAYDARLKKVYTDGEAQNPDQRSQPDRGDLRRRPVRQRAAASVRRARHR